MVLRRSAQSEVVWRGGDRWGIHATPHAHSVPAQPRVTSTHTHTQHTCTTHTGFPERHAPNTYHTARRATDRHSRTHCCSRAVCGVGGWNSSARATAQKNTVLFFCLLPATAHGTHARHHPVHGRAYHTWPHPRRRVVARTHPCTHPRIHACIHPPIHPASMHACM